MTTVPSKVAALSGEAWVIFGTGGHMATATTNRKQSDENRRLAAQHKLHCNRVSTSFLCGFVKVTAIYIAHIFITRLSQI